MITEPHVPMYLANASHYIGEGNGNPLQYSCLESPVDGGAGSLQFMGLQRVGHDFPCGSGGKEFACNEAMRETSLQ